MYLHEEVLLLALRDDTGKIEWKAGNFKTDEQRQEEACDADRQRSA
jgi:hypothetical protein